MVGTLATATNAFLIGSTFWLLTNNVVIGGEEGEPELISAAASRQMTASENVTDCFEAIILSGVQFAVRSWLQPQNRPTASALEALSAVF